MLALSARNSCTDETNSPSVTSTCLGDVNMATDKQTKTIKILNVPSVSADPLRKQYIGKELQADFNPEKPGMSGGIMASIPPAGGFYFWPNEFEMV